MFKRPSRPYWAVASTLVLALALVPVGGCQVDLPRPTEIQFDRPLGARASVVGAPSRATPRPGERVDYRVTVVHRDATVDNRSLNSMFIVCTATEQFTGIPVCAEFLEQNNSTTTLAAGTGGPAPGATAEMPEIVYGDCEGQVLTAGPFQLACVAGEPRFEFQVEQDYTAAAKMVIGLICQDGVPVLDPLGPELLRCEPRSGEQSGEAMSVYGTVMVQHDDRDENHNPDLAELKITLQGQDWPRVAPIDFPPDGEPPSEDCRRAAGDPTGPTKGGPLPLIVAGDSAVEVGLAYRADAIDTDSRTGQREVLEFSVHATMEGLQRRFTVFGPETPATDDWLSSELDFEVPDDESIPEGGQLVRFFFTARDKRGGFDLVERAACVVE